jgi:predicted nuclease with RNAse H fold
VNDQPVIVGIDVAAARPCVAVALRPAGASGRLEAVEWHESIAACDPGECATAGEPVRKALAPADLIHWLEKLSPLPLVIAIDAPQGYNRRLLSRGDRPRRSRVCDYELLRRRVGVYQVPSRAEVTADPTRLAPWISVGLDLHAKIRRRGYEAPADGSLPGALGQPPAVIEVYPYASFLALVGRRLGRKTGREGLRLRVAALRRENVFWGGAGDEYYDHDSLDALAAGLTGWRFLQGAAFGVGDEREGLIWVPGTRERFDHEFPPAGSRSAGVAGSAP